MAIASHRIAATPARRHQTTWEMRFPLSRQRGIHVSGYSATHARIDLARIPSTEERIVGHPHATAVSARVALLIARHYGGDRNAAALSLGIEPDSLTDLLSGDWRRFSLDAMAALVEGHKVSVRWLLGSSPIRQPPRRPAVRSMSLQALVAERS
jgi:hypothetical protein